MIKVKKIGQRLRFGRRSKEVNMLNMKPRPTCYGSKAIIMVQNVGQRSSSQGKRNTHLNYESPTCYGSIVIINVKNVGQRNSQGRKVNYFGTDRKILTQGKNCEI